MKSDNEVLTTLNVAKTDISKQLNAWRAAAMRQLAVCKTRYENREVVQKEWVSSSMHQKIYQNFKDLGGIKDQLEELTLNDATTVFKYQAEITRLYDPTESVINGQ